MAAHFLFRLDFGPEHSVLEQVLIGQILLDRVHLAHDEAADEAAQDCDAQGGAQGSQLEQGLHIHTCSNL